jgi:hypothetical protein
LRRWLKISPYSSSPFTTRVNFWEATFWEATEVAGEEEARATSKTRRKRS